MQPWPTLQGFSVATRDVVLISERMDCPETNKSEFSLTSSTVWLPET